MRAFFRVLRIVSAITLFFFCWSYLPLFEVVAFAATQQKTDARGRKTDGRMGVSPVLGPAERFEKALEDIHEKVGKLALSAVEGAEDITSEIEAIKKQRIEIEKIDIELKREFSATEKKLKDAKLSQEILDRHYKFVKHYEDNVAELKANLKAVERYTVDSKQGKEALKKTKEFLEKTRKPSRHEKFDPSKPLPHRNRVLRTKWREPRTTPEQFRKDFPPQNKKKNNFTAYLPQSTQSAQRTAQWIPDAGYTIQDILNRASWNMDRESVQFGHELARIFTNGVKKKANEQKPILVASNGPLTGLLSSNPEPVALPFTGNGISSGINPDATFADSLSATSYEPSAILLAQATPDLPTPADLAETAEVQFTPEIRDLAAQLGNKPTKIFEWVRNNIEFVPTYGSIQGADMCLQTRQCNAFDTASLLIALLRTSNLPARYVYGTVELPSDKLMNWAGGFTDPMAAATLLASGGIPVKPYIVGSKIAKVQMEHVWVETYIPYGNYRGAIMDQSIKTWIPMDGIFKQFTYTNGFDITGAVPFSQDEYLSQVQSQNPVHYYQSKIQEYLDVNMPDTSIVDVKGYREITQEKYHFLPSTLPYITVAQLGKFSSIPANMAARVTFILSNSATGTDVSYTASTPELAGKRITVSYIPATADDEALIAKYGGFLYDVPAYMLNLKAVLRIEGVVKLTGDATTLGSEQTLTIQFDQPASRLNETIRKPIYAGAYYAVGMDLQGINENVLGKRNHQMTTNVLSETAGTLGNDDLIGEHLFILATTYHLANDKIYKSGVKLYNTVVTRTLSEGIASFTLSVSYIFSIPRSAIPSGIEIDVAMDRVIAVAKDGNVNKEKAYMDISGLTSSYHEHDIFERIDEFSSVSTVRALQVASANGIPIHHIDSVNIGQILPILQVGPEIKADIQNAVNAGREVTISQTNVQINDWLGVGYIVKDPVTGSGAYRITGGLGGGISCVSADGMRIVQMNKEPLGWVKDRLDPQTRNTIITAAELELGEIIAESVGTIADYEPGYEDVGQCSGLVRLVYWTAGICLDNVAPPYGVRCGNSLASKYNVSGSNGVSIHYGLADTMKLNNSVRITNDPLLGDIVFFSNTTGPGHPLNHEGIVVTAPDVQGTVGFIHATKSGVHSSMMNILIPDDRRLNSFIGYADRCRDACYAGQLFSGYGTIRDR